jgi:dGTPase
VSNTLDHSEVLEKEIIRALRCDELDFNGLLSRLRGAQQQRVSPILDKLVATSSIEKIGPRFRLARRPPRPDWANARARVVDLLYSMPPGNPLAGQWWFNFDSAVSLAERVWEAHWSDQVAFLGTPVSGFAYGIATGQPCTIFDFDSDVVSIVQEKVAEAARKCFKPAGVETQIYNSFNDPAAKDRERFDAIVCDPPWYEDYFASFLLRCMQLGKSNGIVFWSVAPLLTRPEAENQRTDFLNLLTNAGGTVLYLDSGALTYVIPEFEAEAYRHIPGFHSKVWRRSDLLVFRLPPVPSKTSEALSSPSRQPHLDACSYYNRKKRIRLFHLADRENAELAVPFKEDKEFGRTVSLHDSPTDHIALWSSQRKGFALPKVPALPAALASWVTNSSAGRIREALLTAEPKWKDAEIKSAIEVLEAVTASAEGKPIIRRYDELRAVEKQNLNQTWAAVEHKRETNASEDPYRLPFQRDRDKILWSKAFKRLASKTQVFPNFGDDRFRTRLTHTLEVAQIARTLTRAFGLNEDLTEAIALAHDIGHTPFGHAGEEAINDFMVEILSRSCPAGHAPSTWFSHYEHGVDVLRWLEDIYFSPGAGRAAGLGVSIEVYEGVFKHMYHRYEKTGDRANKKSQEELYRLSKHQDVISEGYASLEAQAVRVADKICYLVEDIEDGILAGIITLSDLGQCRLFSRPFLDLSQAPGDTQLHRYLSQRGEIINILTKDTLENTEDILQELKEPKALAAYRYYAFRPSDEMAEDISEVWRKIQVGILHNHPRVVGASARASRIVKNLLMLFSFSPRLVESSFREYFLFLGGNYMAPYVGIIGSDTVAISKASGSYFDSALAKDTRITSSEFEYRVPLSNIIMAKDYVASLTDGQALQLHNSYVQAGIYALS